MTSVFKDLSHQKRLTMSQKTKFENEQQRAMNEDVKSHMKSEYLARKQLLIMELKEINEQLEKL